MTGDRQERPAGGQVLDGLMPMHLMLDREGRILSCGPTINRLFAVQSPVGRLFLDLFDLRSPAGVLTIDDFMGIAGQKLRIVARHDEHVLRLRGLLLPVDPDAGYGDWIVNLSFGIDLSRAVAHLGLTAIDFAPTDLAVELLYLAEANESVTGELRALAQRLDNARRQAREEAETDPLTGLRNRRACDSVLTRLCREGEAFALLHMDLDYFKAVNDTLGHAAGDHVLTLVASVMKTSSRAGDCLARVGGDEFVMLLPGAVEARAVKTIGERMIAHLSRPISWNGQECRISASIGFVVVQAGADADPALVMADADHALYAAKDAGRGRVVQGRPSQGEAA